MLTPNREVPTVCADKQDAGSSSAIGKINSYKRALIAFTNLIIYCPFEFFLEFFGVFFIRSFFYPILLLSPCSRTLCKNLQSIV